MANGQIHVSSNISATSLVIEIKYCKNYVISGLKTRQALNISSPLIQCVVILVISHELPNGFCSAFINMSLSISTIRRVNFMETRIKFTAGLTVEFELLLYINELFLLGTDGSF